MSLLKRIMTLFVAVVVFGVYYLFNQSPFMDGSRLNNQISQLIKHKDSSQIKKIAVDDSTYTFLMNLPKNTKPQNTSGNQGGDGKAEYFVTVLDGKKVDVILKTSFRYEGLIKMVKLSQVSLQHS